MCETRRGYAMLLQGGDPEISGALAGGIMKGMEQATPHPAMRATFHSRGRLLEEERRAVEAEIDRQAIERDAGTDWRAVARDVKVAIGRNLGPEDYAIMRAAAEQDYRVHEPGPILRAALGLYGMAIYAGMRFMAWEEAKWRER